MRVRQKLILQAFGQRGEFRLEGIVEQDDPSDKRIMNSTPYGVKIICSNALRWRKSAILLAMPDDAFPPSANLTVIAEGVETIA
jgi:hypothetical protein